MSKTLYIITPESSDLWYYEFNDKKMNGWYKREDVLNMLDTYDITGMSSFKMVGSLKAVKRHIQNRTFVEIGTKFSVEKIYKRYIMQLFNLKKTRNKQTLL